MKKIVSLLLLSIFVFAAPPKFLMPDEAFVPYAKLNDATQIEAGVKIAKDIYLYSEKVTLSLKEGSGITIAKIDQPQSVAHHDEQVYLSSPKFLVYLQKDAATTGMKTVELSISYQGCSEQGLCYEPYSKTFTFDIDSSKLPLSQVKELKSLTLSKPSVSADTPQQEPSVELSETDAIADTINKGSIALILLTFFGFGLLLSLTPCVFPMIPIISGVIISQGEGLTTKKAFFLSVVYVLAMAVAYTIAGVLAGLFGSNLQSALQTPWVIYSFSAVFVALAMSMFGFYELRPPSFLTNKLGESRQHRGVLGVAVMGFLSALIVGPCVAAPLAGALVYIGQTGDALLGGMALFTMSIGMGIPLIAIGVSAGKFMPKPGVWMTMVLAIFGIMMLGVAIWMLERVVEPYVTMLLYAMLGIGSALYFAPFDKEGHIFKRSVAMILFIYSVLLFIGAMGGSTSMSKPLEFLKPQVVTSVNIQEVQHQEFTKVTSIKELDALLEANRGKKILLDFYADWCTSCKEMEEITFANTDVKHKMDQFVLIQADVTQNTKEQKDLSKKYGVFGPPAIIFFDEDGSVMKSKSLVGFIEPKEFLEHLNTI